MGQDLHTIPQLKDSISYIYIEHARIEQEDSSIIILNKEGKIPVPICYMTCLLIGVGTSITHAAIKALSESGCLVVWCNEGIANYYAFGHGETHSSKNLLLQVDCYSNHRIEVATKMYEMRFLNLPMTNMNLNQMRGVEGVRMKALYKSCSKLYGIPWHGRVYEVNKSENTDAVNQALTLANSILYSVCYASIISLGYSPALGFIHTGNQRSFVFDIADLYKADTTIPTAFEAAKYMKYEAEIPSLVRSFLRTKFENLSLLKKIPEDLKNLFSCSKLDLSNLTENNLLDEENNLITGNVNYGERD